MTPTHLPALAKRLAQSIAGLNGAMLLAWLVLSPATSAPLLDAATFAVSAVVYSVLGVLIIAHHPRHTVGWLFVIVGFCAALVDLGIGLRSVESYLHSALRLGLIAAWLLAWILASLLPISLVWLYFPDGRLPARRWWPIPVAMLLGVGGDGLSLMLHPWPWPAQGMLETNNPLGIPGSEGLFERTAFLSLACLAIGVIGSLVALVVRFLRSTGIERIQMNWLVYTAVVGVALLLVSGGLGYERIQYGLLLSLPTLLAVAISIAILRYRLFDIDVIIRRTLVYSLLSVLLALTYFGSVIVLQGLLRSSRTQTPNQLVTVLSTLAIATLFVPLRRQVQAFIDRRFYRQRYDAARTLAGFGAALRDETDLARLSERLVGVVDETMQPARVGLWLRPGRGAKDARP